MKCNVCGNESKLLYKVGEFVAPFDSKIDGLKITIYICDDCLVNFIDNLSIPIHSNMIDDDISEDYIKAFKNI